MAHIWILTHLREPLSTVQPSIHWLSALLELILGRLQEPPGASGSLQFCLPPYSISDFSPTVKPYFFCCFLGREEWRESGGILVYVRQYAVDGLSEILAPHWSSQIKFDQWPPFHPFLFLWTHVKLYAPIKPRLSNDFTSVLKLYPMCSYLDSGLIILLLAQTPLLYLSYLNTFSWS